jgi:hypothetical protein
MWNVSVRSCALFLGLASAAFAVTIQLITNGGFETGDLTGWTLANAAGGSGSFLIQTGSGSPLNNFSVPPPPGGTYAAMTDQGGPGTHVLFQDVTIPFGATSISFSANYFRNNQAGGYITPDIIDINFSGSNQQSFVDILTADSDPLSARSTAVTTLFASAVGDPSNDGTYFLVSANLTGILTPGSTYRLRFVEADNQLFFNNGVDNVSLLAEGGQVPEPSSMILAGAGLVFVGWIRRRSL